MVFLKRNSTENGNTEELLTWLYEIIWCSKTWDITPAILEKGRTGKRIM